MLFIYFLERGEGKEKEREKNRNVWLPLTCPQACALTGNGTGDHLVRRLALNALSYTSQGFFRFFFYCWSITIVPVSPVMLFPVPPPPPTKDFFFFI